MPIFGIGKKKGEPEMPPAPPMPPPAAPVSQPNIPTEQVMQLRSQGLSNYQIVESLQRSGFKTHQIIDALNQTEIGRSAEAVPGAPYVDEPLPPSLQSMQQSPDPQPQYNQPAYQPAQYAEAPVINYDEKIEEIAEAIIEEKWNELLKDLNKIIEWKNSIEANMKALEQRQSDLKASYDSLQKALTQKLGDYDQNITSVGTELKALEKVFQKLLPTFTENVNELSRTVKDLKTKNSK